MRFIETELPGVWVIELEPIADERGWFARTFDAAQFESHGLDATVVQCNASFNGLAGTLRGMHYQSDPRGEPKLVRCTRGAIFDVAVDLRPDSPAFRRWHGVELTPDNNLMLYLPRDVAHGFQTLADETEVLYQMGQNYLPELSRGVRWDDPAFDIVWPDVAGGERIISTRDRGYPDFRG